MFKIILSFLVLFAIFFFGIKQVRKMTGKEHWALTKYVGYSIICAVLTFTALAFIVLIF